MNPSTAELIRLRLRRDPGDTLLVDGKPVKVSWPRSMTRLAPGVMAEVVLDLPDTIQTFPMDAWSGAPDELTRIAWVRTLNRTKHAIEMLDVGLDQPLAAVVGEAPYVTAFALSPCAVFSKPEAPPYVAALVAVPTPELVLLHLFRDASLPGKAEIAKRMRDIATENFEGYEHKRRISPEVYLSRAAAPMALELVA